jgi:hypothetical protein
MKTKEEILKAFETGNYNIEHDSTCQCECTGFENDEINISCGGECWQTNTLIIDGEIICYKTQFESIEIDDKYKNIIDYDDIPNEIDEEITIKDDEENPSHRVSEMVKSYLETLKNAKFYRDNMRGFANEFEIIIDENGDCEEINENWDEIDLDEAASSIAYDGDAATQAYNSVRVL